MASTYTSPIGSGFKLPPIGGGENTQSQTSTPAYASGGLNITNSLQNSAASGVPQATFNPLINSSPALSTTSSPSPAQVVPQAPAPIAAPPAGHTVTTTVAPIGMSPSASASSSSQQPAAPMADPLAGSSTGQASTGFGVTVPNQTNSNVLGAGLSYTDALNARNNLMQDYQSAQNKYVQDYQNLTQQQIKAGFSGDTQQYGTGMYNLVNLETTPVLTADQMSAANALSALNSQQSFAQNINPFQNQLSPGNQAYNPTNNAPVTSGAGASPATVADQAQAFIAQDQSTGNLVTNSDGTINQAYYQQKAQQYYSTGGAAGGTNGQVGAPSSATGGIPTTGAGSLPANIASQPYVIPASGNSPAYINLGRVPAGQQQYVATVAGKAGVPVLSADDASNVQGIQYTQQALQPLEQVMNQVLQPGILGRGLDIGKTLINNAFENQPQLVAFNQARGTAIKVIQSLVAGSGSGFRLTQPEIDTAVDNMPNSTDNLETAQTKLAYVKSYLANELNLKLTGNSNNYVSPSSQSTGADQNQNTVAGSTGPVNYNW